MFGVTGTGDTSGFGGLVRVEPGGAVALHSTERPYGGYFDEVTDALIEAVGQETYDAAMQRVLEATRGAILARKQDGIALLLEQLRSPDKVFFQLGLGTAREISDRKLDQALASELSNTSPPRAAHRANSRR